MQQSGLSPRDYAFLKVRFARTEMYLVNAAVILAEVLLGAVALWHFRNWMGAALFVGGNVLLYLVVWRPFIDVYKAATTELAEIDELADRHANSRP
jgi:hypothetical protein